MQTGVRQSQTEGERDMQLAAELHADRERVRGDTGRYIQRECVCV